MGEHHPCPEPSCRDEWRERVQAVEDWAWGVQRCNGADGSIKALWAAVRGMQRMLWIGVGALSIISPIATAILTWWMSVHFGGK